MQGMRLLTVALAALTALSAVTAYAATDEGEAEETRICPGCGEEIPATSIFCPDCHRYFPDAKVKMVTCPDCGAEAVWTTTICPKCGAYLKEIKPRTTSGAVDGQTRALSKPEYKKRFSGRVRAGAMTTEGYTVPGGAVVLGARISEEVAVGGGFGYQSYPNASSVPLFLMARAFFASGVIEPSVFGEFGYNIAQLKNSWPGATNASGLLVGVGLGLDIVFFRGFGWTLDAGGRLETSKKYYRYVYSNGGMSPVYSESIQEIYFIAGSGVTF